MPLVLTIFWVKAQEIQRDRFLQVDDKTTHQTFHVQKTFIGSSTPCSMFFCVSTARPMQIIIGQSVITLN